MSSKPAVINARLTSVDVADLATLLLDLHIDHQGSDDEEYEGNFQRSLDSWWDKLQEWQAILELEVIEDREDV